MTQPDRDWILQQLNTLTDHADELYELDPDTINELKSWTALKLAILIATVDVYTTIISSHFDDWYYVDAMAGSGCVYVEDNQIPLVGSPILAAVLAHEPFEHMFFIENKEERVQALRSRLEYAVENIEAVEIERDDYDVIKGDTNTELPKIPDRIAENRGHFQGAHHLAFIDNERVEVKYDSIDGLEQMWGDLLINYQETGINREYGDGNWEKLVPYFGTEAVKDCPTEEERFELYLDQLSKVGTGGRPIQRSIKVRGSEDYPYHYNMVYAVRESQETESEWVEFMDTMRPKIEPLSGDDVEKVIEQMQGKTTSLELWTSDDSENGKGGGQSKLGEY